MPYYRDTSNAIHFLDDAAFASFLPDDSVEITDAEAHAHQAATNVPTSEALAAAERNWRDSELASTDPIVMRQRDQIESGMPTTLTVDQYKALQAYRQAIRDWPESDGFPSVGERPVAATWLVQMLER